MGLIKKVCKRQSLNLFIPLVRRAVNYLLFPNGLVPSLEAVAVMDGKTVAVASIGMTVAAAVASIRMAVAGVGIGMTAVAIALVGMIPAAVALIGMVSVALVRMVVVTNGMVGRVGQVLVVGAGLVVLRVGLVEGR